jgi:hypothetical protein
MDDQITALIEALQEFRNSLSEDAYLALLAQHPALDALVDAACDIEHAEQQDD